MNIEKSSALLVIDIQQEDFMEMNESRCRGHEHGAGDTMCRWLGAVIQKME